jgi:hypothetical protein
MRIFKVQSGFSMIQGMVISAVIAASALVTTRMMTTQKMALNSAESKDQISELHKQIFALLQNRDHCLRTFATPLSTVAINGSYPLTDVMSHITGSGTGTTQFTVNNGTPTGATYMNGKVRINSMNLKTTADLGDPQPLVINYMRLEGKPSSTSPGTWNGVRSGSGFGGKSINRTIYIRLQRDSPTSSTINGCYAVETDADSDTGSGNSDLNEEFCSTLGDGTAGNSLYTWDSTRNTCVMKNNVCPDGQVFEGITSTGTAMCRLFDNYIPYFLDTTSKPCPSTKSGVKLYYDAGTHKVSIVCY